MPLPYKPAADSRHRRACLALYRALVHQGRQIPLPNDLLNTTQLKPRNGDSSPITTVINNTFHRNRKITSMRLVSSALKNGYKFLDLLSRARQESTSTTFPPSHTADTPHGPIYTSLLTFLHENRTRVTTFLSKRAAQEAAIARKNKPHPDTVPILTLLPPTEDNPGPVYVPTNRPRPLSELSGGVRKIPTIDECGQYPMLKFGVPHSPIMSGIVRTNSRRRQVRTERLFEMQEIDVWMARMEDEWEVLVDVMLRANEDVEGKNKRDSEEASGEGEEMGDNNFQEGEKGEGDHKSDLEDSEEGRDQAGLEEVLDEMARERRKEWKYGTKAKAQQIENEYWWYGKERRDWSAVENLNYEQSWQCSIDELSASLKTQHDHWVAKGKTMWKLVVEERELAEKEAKERGKKVERPVSSLYLDKVKDWRRTWKRTQVKERVKEMYEAEERGDHETAHRIATEKYKVRSPKRPGFRKEDMIRAR